MITCKFSLFLIRPYSKSGGAPKSSKIQIAAIGVGLAGGRDAFLIC
jgi:hypothetical protein